MTLILVWTAKKPEIAQIDFGVRSVDLRGVGVSRTTWGAPDLNILWANPFLGQLLLGGLAKIWIKTPAQAPVASASVAVPPVLLGDPPNCVAVDAGAVTKLAPCFLAVDNDGLVDQFVPS